MKSTYKQSLLKQMTFGHAYIPYQFTVIELEALKAVSLVWTDTVEDISKAMDIVNALRDAGKDGRRHTQAG